MIKNTSHNGPIYSLRAQALDTVTIGQAAFRDLETIFQAIIATSDHDSLPHQLARVGRRLAEEQANLFDCEREGLEGVAERKL